MGAKRTLFDSVAKEALGIGTLATRHGYELDFHDVAVWRVLDAFGRIWRGRDSEVNRLRQRIASPEAGSKQGKRR